jgi:hypothetical protein
VDWRLERQECNVESVPSGQNDPQSQGTRITHVLRAVCAYRVFTYNALCVANLYTFTRPCTHSLSHFLTRTLTFFQPELTHSLSHTHIYMLTLSHSQVADDGLFWMAFEDYVRHYDGMCISSMYAMRYTFIHYIYTLPLHTTRITTTHYTPPLAHTHTHTLTGTSVTFFANGGPRSISTQTLVWDKPPEVRMCVFAWVDM